MQYMQRVAKMRTKAIFVVSLFASCRLWRATCRALNQNCTGENSRDGEIGLIWWFLSDVLVVRRGSIPLTLPRSVSKSPTLIPASPWHWLLIGSVKDQADHVLQFYNFTPDRKFYTGIARGACNKYQGCGWSCLPFFLLHRLLGQHLLDHVNPVVVLLDQGPSFSHLREKS